MMASRTPNLDRLAAGGMMFTDYYAEASCTAGRASLVTGQLPIRTGLTTVGQAGAHIGIPDATPTIAHALKAQGYATGQFGKNHFGDRNEFLPTVHGFDEFWGYLYHLDAMEDPFHPNYPRDLIDKIGPRNVLHCTAVDKDDPTEHARWGRVGRQKIVDEGPLPPHPMSGVKLNMETVDEAIRDRAMSWMAKQVSAGTPFFCYLNPSRMHVVTHLSDKYSKLRTAENGWTVSEAGMAQLDDVVGAVLKKLDDLGVADTTIVVFTTDERLVRRHRQAGLADHDEPAARSVRAHRPGPVARVRVVVQVPVLAVRVRAGRRREIRAQLRRLSTDAEGQHCQPRGRQGPAAPHRREPRGQVTTASLRRDAAPRQDAVRGRAVITLRP
jgi:hypothetical protein